MTTEVTSTTYTGGKRVTMQRVTYEKSDDLYALANTHRQHETICAQLAAAPAGSDTTYLQTEKIRLEGEITAQQAIVDGYATE